MIEGASEVSPVDFVDLRWFHGAQQSGFFERLARSTPPTESAGAPAAGTRGQLN